MSTASNVSVGLIALVWFALSGVRPGFASGVEPEGARGEAAAHRDVHSYGNPDLVRVRRVALDLSVDFDRRELKGEAVLDIQRQDGGPPAPGEMGGEAEGP